MTKLVNSIMLDGKKGVAQKVVYGAFEIVEEKTGKNGLEAFQQAMENIMPTLEVKTRRVGGANYQVPIEVRPDRRQTLGLQMCIRDRLRRDLYPDPGKRRPDPDPGRRRRSRDRCPGFLGKRHGHLPACQRDVSL